jgi:hypothetical protein
MTDEQKKLYEEVARKLYPDSVSAGNMLNRELFKQGCEFAHNAQQSVIDETVDTISKMYGMIKDLESRNEELTAKAGKWDKLSKQIDGFYKDGSGADLVDIGEACAEAFGYF